MEEKNNEYPPYYLVHISSKKNIDKIINNKYFIKSIHDIEANKIQWLGDGVYFWGSNDTEGKKLGKNLVSGKIRKKDVYGIHLKIHINKDNYLNLENAEWSNKFEQFLKKFQPDYYKKITHYLEMVQLEKHPETLLLNQLGEVTGTALNLFVEVLEENGYTIDMISCYFYHGENSPSLLQRKEKMIQQFCVRNLEIVNNSINDYQIEHII